MQRPFSWYARRIRSMRAGELLHRAQEWAALRRLAAAYRRGTPLLGSLPAAAQTRFCSGTDPRLPQLPWRLPDAGDQRDILAGNWPALGYPWTWRYDASVWHEAPDTGNQWPTDFFGSIPYLDRNPVGDVRVAWEPSRLQQLIALALIANDSDDENARQAVIMLEDQLLSWVAANPHLCGIHYISVMECAQRILATCHALDMVRERLTRPVQVWDALVLLVQSHATLIAQRLSLHSSTGNHTITEAAGLIYAGTLFPELAGAKDWHDLGCAVLDREAAAQVFADGGSAEQAFRYLLLVVDLLGLVVRLFEHHDTPPPRAIAAAFARGRDFLGAFAADFEDLPAIGDSDSGFAVSRYLRLAWEDAQPQPENETFSDAGYTVLHNSTHGVPLRMVFDHGPFGMPPLYGHAHADNLSVILRVGSQDVLIDPGTYSYTGHPEWRRYFRSTPAHNTVTVDDRDQAQQELSFMWSGACPAQLVHRDRFGSNGLLLVGRHEAYLNLGVIHRRGIVFHSPDKFLVIDLLVGNGDHSLELNWHCAGTVERHGPVLTIPTATQDVSLTVEGGDVTVRSASDEPKRGWNAPVYGVRETASTVTARWTGTLPHQFVTRISVGGAMGDDGSFEKMNDALAAVMSALEASEK